MTQLEALSDTLKQADWQWRGWKIHYVQSGTTGPDLVLIHGFGASTDHWRKNIEVLSQHYRVWAIDLLGFGRSQKPKTVYSADLWRDQLQDFCREVVQAPVFIAGNSIGAYAALCFGVDCPDQTQGVILINCAGPFTEDDSVQKTGWQQLLSETSRTALKLPFVIEIASFFMFNRMRDRQRIREVLLKVYKNPAAVTDRLVEEIYRPAFDEGALDVFAAVFRTPSGRKLDVLLKMLRKPLLLIWGEADPWMTTSKAQRFMTHYPEAALEWVDAGHCPHDESPEVVNAILDRWIQGQMESDL